MAYYPQNATGLNYATYPVGPTAQALQVTSSASANTKGSYTQAVASSGFTCNAITFAITRETASNLRGVLADIATGGAGVEVVVIPNVAYESLSSSTSHTPGGTYYFPLSIASGTRISVRNQASTGSTDIFCAITIVAAGSVSGQSTFNASGPSTSTSQGASIDPGGSANTKGSYAQVDASTTAVAQFVNFVVTRGPSATATAAAQWAVDVSTGASGFEVVLLPDLRVSNSAASGTANTRSFNMLTYIPASTRIAARASCDITGSTDRLIGISAYTCVAPTEPSGSAGGAYAFA